MAAAAKASASKAGASKPAMSRVAASPVTAIVSYEVGCEDVDTFMDAWDQANAFLKKQPGHLGTQLFGAVSANPRFRFVAVARWKSADDLRNAIQSGGYAEASGRLSAYPVYGSAYDVIRG